MWILVDSNNKPVAGFENCSHETIAETRDHILAVINETRDHILAVINASRDLRKESAMDWTEFEEVFEDYHLTFPLEVCGDCGFDHDVDYELSAKWHRENPCSYCRYNAETKLHESDCSSLKDPEVLAGQKAAADFNDKFLKKGEP